MQPVQLNELARGTLKLFDAQLRQAGVSARLDLDDAARPVAADPEQFGRALRNLLENAVRYGERCVRGAKARAKMS